MALTIPLTVNVSPQTIPLKATPSEHAVNLRVRMEARQMVNGDYNNLNNKPSINGVTLTGDKTGYDLGLTTFWFGTRDQYNALPSIDPAICYCIEEGT